MLLRKWEALPAAMQKDEIRSYYGALCNKKGSLIAKRVFDLIAASVLLILLSPVLLAVAAAVKIDSRGSVFFRQTRITQYGKKFRIFKFRSMAHNAENCGSQVTTKKDDRITSIGAILRKYRLDEIPQLLNVLAGDMSFVGTRPEVPRYVSQYSIEMWVTLLLPAGVTSEASISYKDEESLLISAEDADKVYIQTILPEKMKYNLAYIRDFRFWKDILCLAKTVLAVLR